MISTRDALLARLAVEKGFISSKQMGECLREQTRGGDPERTLGSAGLERPLAAILLSKGFILEKDLTRLLEEHDRKLRALENYRKMAKVEYLFGQLLVKENTCTQNQINKCLEIQQRMAEQGKEPIPRLGELLVEYGYVDKQTVACILQMQHKDLLVCTGCGRQFNVVGLEEGRSYRCKQCGGLLTRKSPPEFLRAEETGFEFERPSEEK